MAAGARPARHQRHASRIAASRAPIQQYEERDKATVAYVKQVFYGDTHILANKGDSRDAEGSIDSRLLRELLPPLTSNSDLDLQLYAIIAAILSQFVQSWYNKITPDSAFVLEVVNVISHCTQGLEERFEQIDLETLLLDELPSLLDAHLEAVQVAQRTTSHRDLPEDDRRTSTSRIYHALRPHNALSPYPGNEDAEIEQRDHEVAWSQTLVNAILPLLLPPNDLANPCLSALVSEIFSELILRNAVLGKLSEPWLLWDATTKLLKQFRPTTVLPPLADETSRTTSRLDQYGLLSSAEAAAKRAVPEVTQHSLFDSCVVMFWSILQYAVMIWSFLRALTVALLNARALPSVPEPKTNMYEISADKLEVRVGPSGIHPSADSDTQKRGAKRPIVGMAVWSCVERLTLLHQRMPWLTGCVSLLKWLSIYGPGSICGRDSAIDRLLSHRLRLSLNTALALQTLRSIRAAAFPDNALALGRPPPSNDEIVTIKQDCSKAILEALPEVVARTYFATSDKEKMQREVEGMLEVFGTGYVNKHLIVGVLELVIVRLFPELAVEDLG
ncbi:hypothetical protein LTR62_006301 [Meristemomyces frigidus]|uniref:PXA domain-containing protein n=1 Tax=Meristemomyces frigidus TaxID=1508187 RepID=A0AAN7TD17_9PEZI|nr:hypothetical protein LTR62_006301 [Meristemomyces frigidus]